MKSTLKKLSVLLGVLLVAVALTGCTAKKEEPTATPAPVATEVAPLATEVAPAATEAAPLATEVAPAATEAAPLATEVAPVATEAALVVAEPVASDIAQQNIVDIAVGNPDFSILVSALQKAELVEALQGEGPLTVFAPTNAAFEKLLNELNITAEDLLNHPQLKDVLLYHVVSGKVLSTDLTSGMEAETLGGQKITVDLADGVKINKSTVTAADLEASNGVIHVIDTVLVPETFKLNP